MNQCLKNAIDKLGQYSEDEDSAVKRILVKLQYLMKAKLLLTAEEDLLKEQTLHRLFQDNEKMLQKISDLRKEVEEGQLRFDELLKIKLEQIEKNRRHIEELNDTTRSYLNAEM